MMELIVKHLFQMNYLHTILKHKYGIELFLLVHLLFLQEENYFALLNTRLDYLYLEGEYTIQILVNLRTQMIYGNILLLVIFGERLNQRLITNNYKRIIIIKILLEIIIKEIKMK